MLSNPFLYSPTLLLTSSVVLYLYMKKQTPQQNVKNVYKKFSALVWQEGNLFVSKAIEVEVASQGKTKKEAILNLKEALELFFENEPTEIIPQEQTNISFEKVRICYA